MGPCGTRDRPGKSSDLSNSRVELLTPGIAVVVNHDKVVLGSIPFRSLTRLPVRKLVTLRFSAGDFEDVIGQGLEQASHISPLARAPGAFGIPPNGSSRTRGKFSQCQTPRGAMAKVS
jgi:hypothetical protein